MATEAVKLLLGKGEPLIGRLLLYDALSMKFRELKVNRDKSCPICGENPKITELISDYVEFCEMDHSEAELATAAD
jgi:adenylyltransferase/sulfurtransferase